MIFVLEKYFNYLVFQSVKVENFQVLIDRNIKCHLMSVLIIQVPRTVCPWLHSGRAQDLNSSCSTPKSFAFLSMLGPMVGFVQLYSSNDNFKARKLLVVFIENLLIFIPKWFWSNVLTIAQFFLSKRGREICRKNKIRLMVRLVFKM